MSIELPTGVWLRTKDVPDALNISRATLTRRKSEGWFKPGTHFLRSGTGDTSNLLWNVDSCRKVLAEMAAPESKEGKAND